MLDIVPFNIYLTVIQPNRILCQFSAARNEESNNLLPYAAEGDGGHGRVATQLRVRVRVPAAHVVAVPVGKHEGLLIDDFV